VVAMTEKTTLEDEIAHLKAEISQLKSENKALSASAKEKAAAGSRSRQKQVSSAQEDPDESQSKSADDRPDLDSENLKKLGDQLNDLAKEAGDEIASHPVATALGAFALGILVGSILRR
jgi:2,3-bisphosphoglycerate-independent phosphoglycerate mutase